MVVAGLLSCDGGAKKSFPNLKETEQIMTPRGGLI